MLFLNGMWKYYILIRMLIHIKFNPNIGELHVENSNKYRSSVFLQILFLYIFISGILLELNPWYAVVVYISLAVLSLVTGIYSIVRSARENSSAALLTIPIGVVTTIFSVIIISFTVFCLFLPEGECHQLFNCK